MTCPFNHSDGAYVLGALSPTERAAYQGHLAGCEACAAAVAGLAPVPGLLGRVDSAALNLDTPRPDPLPQLIQAVTTERRRAARVGRWRLAGAALGTLVLAVAATVGIDAIATGPPTLDAVVLQEMRPVTPDVDVTARIGLAESSVGTEVRLTCAYPAVPPEELDDHPYPYPFLLVAVGADGSLDQVGSWLAAPGDEVTMTGVTRLTGDDLARLELRSAASGRRLLTYRVP